MATEAEIYKKFLAKTGDADTAAELTEAYLESKKPAPKVEVAPTNAAQKGDASVRPMGGSKGAVGKPAVAPVAKMPEAPKTVGPAWVWGSAAPVVAPDPATEKISRLEYAGRKYHEWDTAAGEPVRAAAREIQATGPALKAAVATDAEAVDDALAKNQREIDARNADHPMLGRLGAWLLDPEVEVPYTPKPKPVVVAHPPTAYMEEPERKVEPAPVPPVRTYGPPPPPPADTPIVLTQPGKAPEAIGETPESAKAYLKGLGATDDALKKYSASALVTLAAKQRAKEAVTR